MPPRPHSFVPRCCWETSARKKGRPIGGPRPLCRDRVRHTGTRPSRKSSAGAATSMALSTRPPRPLAREKYPLRLRLAALPPAAALLRWLIALICDGAKRPPSKDREEHPSNNLVSTHKPLCESDSLHRKHTMSRSLSMARGVLESCPLASSLEDVRAQPRPAGTDEIALRTRDGAGDRR